MYSDEALCAACREPMAPEDFAVTCSVCREDAHSECVEWVPSPTRSRWLDPEEQVPICLACIDAAEGRRVVGL